eukprot:8388548-Lingulodinium_polyedra.AAC.1
MDPLTKLAFESPSSIHRGPGPGALARSHFRASRAEMLKLLAQLDASGRPSLLTLSQCGSRPRSGTRA